MVKEIEKKYLIREDDKDFATNFLIQMYSSVESLKKDVLDNGQSIRQGYLPLKSGLELSDKLNMDVDFKPSEARLRDKSGTLYFTLKGSGGLSRNELEVKLDESTFNDYWEKTEGNRVEKIRLESPCQGYTAEIDVYTDRELIVAEIEVPTIKEAKKLTSLGKDVTIDKAYKNKNLAK